MDVKFKMSKQLKACWLKSPAPGNFGDILTPFILNHYGFRVNYVHWNNIQQADVICVGSIARLAIANTIVLGSGIMSKGEQLCADAKWKWVRGPLTRNLVLKNGGYCPEIYGDAAMLLPKIWPGARRTLYKIGIVPHYVDYELIKQKYPDEFIVNLVDDNPKNVIKQITSCDCIISSSLHGIIAAHAYGIPAAWVKFSNKIKGDDSKFYDHYLSMGIEAKLSTIESPIFQLGKYDNSLIDNILQEKLL